MHHIKEFVQDSNLDAKRLIVSDVSAYDLNLAIKDRTCFIQPPGYDPVEVILPTSGTASYSSKALGISKEVCVLPDGLYAVTLSVNPNSRVYDVVYHYRTAYLEQQLCSILSKKLLGYYNQNVDCRGDLLNTRIEKDAMAIMILVEGLRGSMDIISDLKAADEQYNEARKILDRLKKENV